MAGNSVWNPMEEHLRDCDYANTICSMYHPHPATLASEMIFRGHRLPSRDRYIRILPLNSLGLIIANSFF
jgi:hypothetical protein